MHQWPVVLAAPPDCGAIADAPSRCYGSLPAAGIAVVATVAAAVIVGHALLAAFLPSALTMVAPPGEGLAGPGDTTTPQPQWPPPGPTGPKPALGQPGAAEWRYERYRLKLFQQGRPSDSVLPYEQWRQTHYEAAASGGRPGRLGGPVQVAAKSFLLTREGVRPVENVRLGPRFPDGIRANRAGGTDYFEVGKMTRRGLPFARERVKLADEAPALGPHDTLTFVDERNPARRITYLRGDDPLTKYLS